MLVTRRPFLALAPAGVFTGLTLASASAEPADADTERLRALTVQELALRGLPGALIAVADADGYARTECVGVADVTTGAAVTGSQLFQIGSISKSVVALAIHTLMERGALSLETAIRDVLPDVPLPDAGIRIEHLLDHSSGLPESAPPLLAPWGTPLWVGFDPGARFSYSNTGYYLLGMAIEQRTGLSFAEALRQLVLVPLGMRDSVAVTRIADRARFATGHIPYLEDRPFLPGARLNVGPWVEMDDPAGSVAVTGADMCRYLEFIARLMRGQGAPLFSNATAALFANRPGFSAPEYSDDARYANGFVHRLIDGRACIEHTGGMPSFIACATIDLATGAGCFVGINATASGYRPRALARFGAFSRANARQGAPPPEAPALSNPFAVENARRYAGRYYGSDGRFIDLRAERSGLALIANGRAGRMMEGLVGSFATDHADFAQRRLEFDTREEQAREVWWGGQAFAKSQRARARGRDDIHRYAGVYVGEGSWSGGVGVYARADELFIEGWGRLVAHDDGSWRFADPAFACERVRFGAVVSSQCQRMNVSGYDLRRCAHRSD